jgi:exopolysaccharide biosynthesis protein
MNNREARYQKSDSAVRRGRKRPRRFLGARKREAIDMTSEDGRTGRRATHETAHDLSWSMMSRFMCDKTRYPRD